MIFRIEKNVIDFISAIILLIILAPIILVLGLILLISLKGNPLFYQKRIGLKGMPFNLIKFRSMTSERDSFGALLPDNLRMTKVGQFLRNVSLDELPQLINVIKGDMSLVGPRPLLPEYIPLYNSFQQRRHDVKPGITGWAQVNGRNAISWEKKFELDVWYVDNQNFILDLKILWYTLIKVIKSDGVSSESSVTMEKFTGSA